MAFDSAPATPVQPAAPAMRDRNAFRLQPLRAAKALRKLIADKEDTAQVFEIMRALSGDTIVRGYKRLLSTPQGGRIAYQREEFCERLSDTTWLNTFGPGTVGEAYRNFIAPRGLSAEGLAEESRKTAEGEIDAPHPFAWYGRRMRDVHDVWHVLTGYSTDGLGEACVVAFSYSQTRSLGFALIAHAGDGEVARLDQQAIAVDDDVLGVGVGEAGRRQLDLDAAALQAAAQAGVELVGVEQHPHRRAAAIGGDQPIGDAIQRERVHLHVDRAGRAVDERDDAVLERGRAHRDRGDRHGARPLGVAAGRVDAGVDRIAAGVVAGGGVAAAGRRAQDQRRQDQRGQRRDAPAHGARPGQRSSTPRSRGHRAYSSWRWRITAKPPSRWAMRSWRRSISSSSNSRMRAHLAQIR